MITWLVDRLQITDGRAAFCAAALHAVLLISCMHQPAAAAAGETRRIVLLHSFGRDFLPWTGYSRAIRAELERQSPWPLEISDYSLLSARGTDQASDRPFVEYLHASYPNRPPDLVVSVGGPAAAFVQRYRQELFPGTPLLLTAVDQRRLDPEL